MRVQGRMEVAPTDSGARLQQAPQFAKGAPQVVGVPETETFSFNVDLSLITHTHNNILFLKIRLLGKGISPSSSLTLPSPIPEDNTWFIFFRTF